MNKPEVLSRLRSLYVSPHKVTGLTIAGIDVSRNGSLLVFTSGQWTHTETDIDGHDILHAEHLRTEAISLGLVTSQEVDAYAQHVQQMRQKQNDELERMQYARLKEKFEGGSNE